MEVVAGASIDEAGIFGAAGTVGTTTFDPLVLALEPNFPDIPSHIADHGSPELPCPGALRGGSLGGAS